MTQHYSEADLLETYYTQPGQSMPVMMHLAQCSDCATRYERLERKVRDLASCHTEAPESFWAAQRTSIMRRVGAPRASARVWLRMAAVAVLAFVLGGVVLQRNDAPQPVAPQKTTTVASQSQPVQETSIPSDPWESDELKEFGAVVEWESWLTEADTKGEKAL